LRTIRVIHFSLFTKEQLDRPKAGDDEIGVESRDAYQFVRLQ